MKHKHGGDVYRHVGCLDFSANCNPLGTPPKVKEAIIASLDSIYEYPRVGCGPLREAIAEKEGLTPDQVVCGNGAAEVIFSLVRATKPKKALLPAPTFAEYEQALSSADCEIVYYRMGEDFTLTDQVLSSLTADIDLFFLCNPNNPTGLLTERDLLLRILARCEANGIRLIVDECFLDFTLHPAAYTLIPLLEVHPSLFILKAFTKRYGMAGVRLGYGLTSDRSLLERMEEMTQPWNVSTLAQAAGLAALDSEDFAEAGRQLVFQERPYLQKEMMALGLLTFPADANYIFFQGPNDLYDRCVEKGILIRDCSNYPGLGPGYFRVAVKTPEENQKLIQTLTTILRG